MPVPSDGAPPGVFLDIDGASDTEVGDMEPSDLLREPTKPGSALPPELLEDTRKAGAGVGGGSPAAGLPEGTDATTTSTVTTMPHKPRVTRPRF